MQFAGSTAVSLAGQRGRRGLFLAQSNPAPKKPASTTPLRMAPVALAVEGPGSGRRRFPEPFETSSSATAVAASSVAPPSAADMKAATTEPHPCVSTKDAYSSFQRVAGPPIDPELLAMAAAGPPLSASVVAEVAGGPLSGRRVRPPPFDADDDGGEEGGEGEGGKGRRRAAPRVPAAADREESAEALLREVRSRHGGC